MATLHVSKNDTEAIGLRIEVKKIVSLISNYFLTKDAAVDVIRKAGANDHPCQGIRINAVYTRCNDEWRFLIGRCTPNSACSSDLHLSYQNHVFVSRVATERTYTDIMERLNVDGLALSSGLSPIKIYRDAGWQHNVIPSSHSQFTTPIHRFSICCEPQTHCWEGKLIKHGLPFRNSSVRYIRDFLALDTFHGDRDSRNGTLILDVPETRGRIIVKDSRISIQSEVPDLCIVGECPGVPIVSIKSPESLAVTPQDLKVGEFWLISKDDEIIDFISPSEMPPIVNQTDNIDYESMIRGGECENCEFKPYISLGNHKAEELIKAVCAMSNSQGGCIFIGVNDDTEVCGISDHEIQKDYKIEPDDALRKYDREVSAKLREGLTAVQL